MALAHNLEIKPRTEDVKLQQDISFTSLLLNPKTMLGLEKSGFRKPSPIQHKAIPIGKCGFDLVLKSKSGTGKTAVFAIIALEMIDLTRNNVQVLIAAPTREIAVQIQDVIQTIGSEYEGLKVHAFIGGMPLDDDTTKLQRCHIAVGAPGRLKHLVDLGHLDPSFIKLFILDEVDKLLQISYQSDINQLFHKCPVRKQMLAISATYADNLDTFISKYMHSPTFITPETESCPILLGLRQFLAVVRQNPNQILVKNEVLASVLSRVEFTQCLVFSNYQTRVESVTNALNNMGFKATYISAAQTQPERLKSIESLKTFQSRVILSTDLTGRGIDASNIDLVINYDVPIDASTYLHRMGRAGRFGARGLCITLATKGREVNQFQKVLGVIGGVDFTIAKLPLEDFNSATVWTSDLSGFEQVSSLLPTEADLAKLKQTQSCLLELKEDSRECYKASRVNLGEKRLVYKKPELVALQRLAEFRKAHFRSAGDECRRCDLGSCAEIRRLVETADLKVDRARAVLKYSQDSLRLTNRLETKLKIGKSDAKGDLAGGDRKEASSSTFVDNDRKTSFKNEEKTSSFSAKSNSVEGNGFIDKKQSNNSQKEPSSNTTLLADDKTNQSLDLIKDIDVHNLLNLNKQRQENEFKNFCNNPESNSLLKLLASGENITPPTTNSVETLDLSVIQEMLTDNAGNSELSTKRKRFSDHETLESNSSVKTKRKSDQSTYKRNVALLSVTKLLLDDSMESCGDVEVVRNVDVLLKEFKLENKGQKDEKGNVVVGRIGLDSDDCEIESSECNPKEIESLEGKLTEFESLQCKLKESKSSGGNPKEIEALERKLTEFESLQCKSKESKSLQHESKAIVPLESQAISEKSLTVSLEEFNIQKPTNLELVYQHAFDHATKSTKPHWLENIGEDFDEIAYDNSKLVTTENLLQDFHAVDFDEIVECGYENEIDEVDENCTAADDSNLENLEPTSREKANKRTKDRNTRRAKARDRRHRKNSQVMSKNMKEITVSHEYSNNEVFNSHFQNCTDRFMTEIDYVTNDSIDEWFANWQQQVACVRDYTQQYVYVQEMSYYQYYNQGNE